MKKDKDIKIYDLVAILFFGIIAVGSVIGICFGAWHQALVLSMALAMIAVHYYELKKEMK